MSGVHQTPTAIDLDRVARQVHGPGARPDQAFFCQPRHSALEHMVVQVGQSGKACRLDLIAGLGRGSDHDDVDLFIADSDADGPRPTCVRKGLIEPKPGLWRSCVPGIDCHWTILAGLHYVYTIIRANA